MHAIRTVIGSALALALAGVSVICAATFGGHLGVGWESWLFMTLGGVADALKSLLPLSVSAAIGHRHVAKALIATVLFTIFSAYSLTAEIGLYSLARDAAQAGTSASRETYQGLKSERERIAARLHELGSTRPSGAVEADIAAQRLNRQWQASGQCKGAYTAAARDLCGKIERLEGELASAQEAEKLRASDRALLAKLAGVNIADAMRSADPQSEALARLLGIEPGRVRDALALLVAVLIELGSGFGLFAVSGHGAGQGQAKARLGDTLERTGTTPASVRPRKPAKGKAKGDPLKAFVKDAVAFKSGAEVTAAAVFLAYEKWCQTNGQKPLTATGFGRALNKAGWTRTRRGGIARYSGVELKAAPAPRLGRGLKLVQGVGA